MEFQVLKGTHDIIKDDADIYSFVEGFLKENAKNFGFSEFRIPIIEKTELFTRSTGESSDVVRKEMYTFLDKGDRSITLRPEFTAGIIRSIVNNKLLHTQELPVKSFYVGPAFRYERPQQGRYRQFIQFGVESVGSDHYLRDAEVILFGISSLYALGFSNLTLKINTIGDEESRKRYKEALVEYFSKHIDCMCGDCKERLRLNPLRILDCKDEKDREIIKNAPKIEDYLSENSKNRFNNLLSLLANEDIKVEVDRSLVRGLDYYSETVFEYHLTSNLGNNYGAIGGGGHYSNLVKELGGPDLPGVGLSLGIDRLVSILKDDNSPLIERNLHKLHVYLISLLNDDEALCDIFSYANFLRINGLSLEMNIDSTSFSSKIKKAAKRNAKFALIIGEDEYKNDNVTIKNLETQQQVTISLEDSLNYIFDELYKHECHCHHEDGECHCHEDDSECEKDGCSCHCHEQERKA